MSRRARRVAVLCPSPRIPVLAPGGASVHLRALAQGFQEAGAETRIWAMRLHRGGDTPELEPPEGVTVEVAPRGRLPGTLRRHRPWDEAVDARAMTRWALRRARAFQPDLLYERWSLFAAVGRKLAPRLGVPWVLEVNAPLAWEAAWFEGLEASPALLRREERCLRAADRVLVVSEELEAYVLRRGVDPSRVLLRPNGASEGERGGLRSPRAGSAGFTLGYAGTFKPWQGLVAALPALVQLRDQLAPRPLRLELWGDGPERRPFLAALDCGLQGVEVDWKGWGDPDRSGWDAAWVPLAAWPPDSAGLEEAFGEPPPGRYFSPLKEAEARAAGLPCWYGDGRGLIPPGDPPALWADIARDILGQGLPPEEAAWETPAILDEQTRRQQPGPSV